MSQAYFIHHQWQTEPPPICLSVVYAVPITLHLILQHLWFPGSDIHLVFIDYNTNRIKKSSTPSFHRNSLIRSLLSLSKSAFGSFSCPTPWCSALSPFLFCLVTNCCVSSHRSIQMVKFVNGTMVGLIANNESVYKECYRHNLQPEQVVQGHTPSHVTCSLGQGIDMFRPELPGSKCSLPKQ